MNRAIIAIAAVLAAVVVCHGRTITVGDDGAADFSAIQGAIDDSNDGDTGGCKKKQDKSKKWLHFAGWVVE